MLYTIYLLVGMIFVIYELLACRYDLCYIRFTCLWVYSLLYMIYLLVGMIFVIYELLACRYDLC